MSRSPALTQSPSPSQSFHYPGCLNLSIVQHNCLGSSNVFQTLFSFFTSVESSPHIVALQDIPLWRNCPPAFRNYKCFFPPATDNYKPRVATYVNKRLLSVISILPLFFERGDLMAVNFHSSEGLFDASHNLFCLYNAYSIPDGHTRSVSAVDLFPQHDFPSLVLGDLNIHHLISDPTRFLSGYYQFISSPYFDRASALLFSLLNTPGVYTRFPVTSNHRPAVLDLSFANSALLPYFSSWNPSLPPTSSDHTALSIILSTPLLKLPPRGLNWKLTDWDHISPLLTDLTLVAPPALPTPNSLGLWFDDSLAIITHLITSNTPTKRPSFCSKPWWTPELTQLQRIHHHTTRLMRKNQSSPALARAARNMYFNAIQTAKRVHWWQFLANVDSNSVWDARRIAAGRAPDWFPTLENASSPTEINNTLLQHFFPPRPSPPPPLILPAFKDVPPVSPAEVSSALRKSSNTSAPGPSGIPYSIWKQVHKANELLLPALFTPPLTHGYHPLAMKKANGIVLDKPGKPDYRTPASFRIIVLLETVSKILERLSALRLASAARSLGLLHPNQSGSLAGLGCFDAVATLTHEVRLLQAASCKVSTLFLDIKGGFDNVCANKLGNALTKVGVSAYLVAWIKSFLSKRQCRLIFQGAPKVFCPVEVGTP